MASEAKEGQPSCRCERRIEENDLAHSQEGRERGPDNTQD
jgi:hypothetical protein